MLSDVNLKPKKMGTSRLYAILRLLRAWSAGGATNGMAFHIQSLLSCRQVGDGAYQGMRFPMSENPNLRHPAAQNGGMRPHRNNLQV